VNNAALTGAPGDDFPIVARPRRAGRTLVLQPTIRRSRKLAIEGAQFGGRCWPPRRSLAIGEHGRADHPAIVSRVRPGASEPKAPVLRSRVYDHLLRRPPVEAGLAAIARARAAGMKARPAPAGIVRRRRAERGRMETKARVERGRGR